MGIVVGGSLSSGLEVKIDSRLSIEKLAVGRYVVVEGRSGRRFFGIITDIRLDSTNPDLSRRPPDTSDEFVADVYSSTVAFGVIHVTPMLMLDEEQEINDLVAYMNDLANSRVASVEVDQKLR